MKFGYFDDINREYVIETPKTPIHGSTILEMKAFGLISNTSGGYCFYRDARLRRVTRYRYNNIPVDNGGRYFYINDGGDVWTPVDAGQKELMPMNAGTDWDIQRYVAKETEYL